MSAALERAPAPVAPPSAPATPALATIVIERRLPHGPDRVWRMLTDSASIAKWLMPNDFAPVLGHRFTLHAPCATGWDGIIRCEVLEIDPPRRLRYSWVSGASGELRDGGPSRQLGVLDARTGRRRHGAPDGAWRLRPGQRDGARRRYPGLARQARSFRKPPGGRLSLSPPLRGSRGSRRSSAHP